MLSMLSFSPLWRLRCVYVCDFARYNELFTIERAFAMTFCLWHANHLCQSREKRDFFFRISFDAFFCLSLCRPPSLHTWYFTLSPFTFFIAHIWAIDYTFSMTSFLINPIQWVVAGSHQRWGDEIKKRNLCIQGHTTNTECSHTHYKQNYARA